MKRLIIAALLFPAILAFGQTQVSISGTVTESPTGFPVPDQPVLFSIMIGNDSLNLIYADVLTNDSGFYYFAFPLTENFARVEISTPDCNGTMLSASHIATPDNSQITQNFTLCDNTGGCMAQFTYYPDSVPSGYGFQFLDQSGGSITGWSWSFGDGTFSQEQNPFHIFPAVGTYEVCLTISGPDCLSTWCGFVTAGNYGDCYNFFTYQVAGTEAAFQGNHFPSIPSVFSWDFGDGTTGEGQYVSHTYAQDGVYFVSLITSDSMNCSATSGQAVVVGDTILFNQVYGQVFEGFLPMQEGFVMIASVQQNPGFEPFTEVAPVDSAGVFVFPYVPAGQFVLYAIPEPDNGYLPTYFGGSRHWTDATAFNATGSGMIYTIGLAPLNASPQPGNGFINGFINPTGLREDMIQNIQVILYSETFEPLGFTRVSPDGSFTFENLAEGLYYIHPELPGVDSYPLAVEITGLTFESVVFLSYDGTSILGEEELQISGDDISVYPNPAATSIKISLQISRPSSLDIKIADLAGRIVFSGIYEANSGQTLIELPVDGLVPGIYFLQIRDRSGQLITKKFVKG